MRRVSFTLGSFTLGSFTLGTFVIAVLAAACGGRAALEAYALDDDGGGGEGATTTTSPQTSSSMQTTSSTSQNSSSTTMTSVVSSSTGPSQCDFTGDCGLCAQCAYEGPCFGLFDACFNSQACVEFLACFEECQGQPGCFLGCAQGNEEGAQMYLSAIQCIACEQCPVDCQGQFPPQVCN